MHIPDASREKDKVALQDEFDRDDPFIKTDKVYKPTYTIEFNRVGDVLLYSCEPVKHVCYLHNRIDDHIHEISLYIL